MSSSSENQQQSQPRQETSNPPQNNPPPPPGSYPPPSMGYPHGQLPGYPPSTAFPHAYPPSNYTGYSQTQYPGYTYAQAPPANYYPNQTYPAEPVNSGIARGIIAAMILLMVLMCLSSITTWLILRPENPIFKIDSLSVTDLNLVNRTGTWEAVMTVDNPNPKLNIQFDRIQTFVSFKDHSLGVSYGDPFMLETHRSREVAMKISSENAGLSPEWEKVAGELAGERATGVMSFDLKMFAWSTLRSESWWAKRTVIRAFCKDLKVAFGADKNKANLLPNLRSKACTVFV